ncbi:coiled-coil domain-containing protein 186 isoform X1 [Onthophagus taurus]|uniref:coiled-coil domain-containing protein 186 isoform X1 n=1 Tax=Onthophagus taurus TaxID=166361 RepID=UPI0039BDB769
METSESGVGENIAVKSLQDVNNFPEGVRKDDFESESDYVNSSEDDNKVLDSETECEKVKVCGKCEDLEVQLLSLYGRFNGLEEKFKKLGEAKEMLQSKYDNVLKEKEQAVKDKETMVLRYACSEKNVIEQKYAKDALEKKHKECLREIDILQYKVNQMGTEKARICQMLDNKCHELKQSQTEVQHTKTDLANLETKMKWLQNNLKSELDMRKEKESKIEGLNVKLQEVLNEIDQTKKESQESIKNFHTSQENRAHLLDQQLKEQQATLIMLRHEKNDKEQQIKLLQSEMEKAQSKHKNVLDENNELSQKVQQLERDRLEMEQKLSELRCYADQQREDAADLCSKNAELAQIKLQLKNEQEQLSAYKEQMNHLKLRNSELESDMESCHIKEADLLLFTQQLTDKNVRLQSEFTAMETKVQQLICEQTLLKRGTKEQETKAILLSNQLMEEKKKSSSEIETLLKKLEDKSKLCDQLTVEIGDQKGENAVIKRKFELSLREVNKELNQCRKKLDQYENNNCLSTVISSSSSSSTSLNGVVTERNGGELLQSNHFEDQVKVVQPERVLDKQALIEHIVKLQRVSARKSEKIDFLEEHVNTLVAELQKKSRLLHNYILREQTGALSSNSMDNNKAILAKYPGVMSSMYSSKISDNNLTLELSLDINRKLQAVLEDALLENITLKENVDTLGVEIEKLSKKIKT